MAYLNPIEMEELRIEALRSRIGAIAAPVVKDRLSTTSGRAELEAGISPENPAPFGEITPESAEPFRYQPQVQPQTRLQQAQTGFSVQPSADIVRQPNQPFLKGEDPQVPIRTGPNTAYLPGGSIEGRDRKLFIDADGTMTNFPTSRDVERFAVKVAQPTSADLVSNLRQGAVQPPVTTPQTKEDWEIYEHETRSRNIDLSTVRIGAKGQRIGLTPKQQEADKARLITTYDPQEGEAQPKLNILAGESSPMTSSLLSGPYAKTMTNALIRAEYEFDYKVRPKLAGVRSVEDIDKLAKGMETYNPKLASQIKVMFERGLARANPERYDKFGLSQFAESPLTQSDKDRVFDEKTGQTFGSEEASLRAEINAYRNATTPAQAAKLGEAQVKLNDLHKRVIAERSAAQSAVELSDAASLAKQVAGEDPEAADLAAKVYEGVATKEDLPYLHADKVKAQISDESWSDVLSEEMVGAGAEGISRVVASKAVLSKQVAKDLTDRLAKGYSATAMHDSVKAVLSRYGKNAAVLFGKEVTQDYIKELVTASQGEYDKQAQEAYARMDARKVERMQTVIDEYKKTGPMPTNADVELHYKAVQAKKDDAQFIMNSNIGGASGALDTAKDYSMADIMLNWPELEHVARAYYSGKVNVAGVNQVAGLLAANEVKFNTQLLSDTAKKMEDSPEAWAKKRETAYDYRLKNENLLTVWSDSPTSLDVQASFYNDATGREKMDKYVNATPGERVGIAASEAERIKKYSRVMLDAKNTVKSFKQGFLPVKGLSILKPAQGDIPADVRRIDVSQRIKTVEQLEKYKQEVANKFLDFDEAYDMVMPALEETTNHLKDVLTAGKVGYKFDEMPKERQGRITEIRETHEAFEAAGWRIFDEDAVALHAKEERLWKELWNSFSGEEKKALSDEVLFEMPSRLEPDVALNSVAAQEKVVAGQQTLKPPATITMTFPDGSVRDVSESSRQRAIDMGGEIVL